MGKTLFDRVFSVAKQTFEEANDILGFNLQKICFEGSLVELNQIQNMFLAILTVSIAAFKVYWQEIGIIPQYLAGHSLGEYSALACSEAIRFADTLKIVFFRSMLAQTIIEKEIGLMTVVNGINKDIVEDECEKKF